MIKKIFFLRTKKGSIITILISLGLLGISSAALVGYIQNTKRTTLNTTSQHNVSYIHYDIINKLRGVLIETKIDQSGNRKDQNKWGICSLVKIPQKQHGIDSIEIDLSLAAKSFSNSRWQTFFNRNEYQPSSDSACKEFDSTFQSNHFSRCFKYIGKAHETSKEIHVIARIIPQKFPDFTPVKNIPLDPKLVIFKLQVIVGIDEGTNTIPFKYETITWSNEIVECEVKVRGKWINVQFSGTGTGRLSKKLVVNHSFFNTTAKECKEVEFKEIPSEVIRTGKIVATGKAIAANHIYNDKISCRKKIYRCPNHNDKNTDFSDTIFFNMETVNNSGGNLHFNKFNFTLLHSDGTEIDSANEQIDSLNVNIATRGGLEFLGNETIDPAVGVELAPGSNYFTFVLEDKSPDSLVNLCKKACNGEKFYPAVSMKFDHPPGKSHCVYSKSYTEDDYPEYRIGCKVCHSKICTKVGLGAFGPKNDDGDLQGLVDEPLDGTIPECKLPLKTETNKYKLPKISKGSGDCVAMSTSSFKNFKTEASYEFKNCSLTLPVLCFAYGHYMPAISISPGLGPTIFKGNFQSAQEACYRMGREIIEKQRIAGFFISSWLNLPFSGNDIVSYLNGLGLPGSTSHFDYINNATRGLFLVPFYDINKISKRLSEKNESANQASFLEQARTANTHMWVAIEKDDGKQIIGSIPQATVATSRWALFTRKETRPVPIVLNNTNTVSDSGTDTVLIHNLQYKGVVNVSGGSYPILCRKKYGDFILIDNTSLKNAPAACKAKGAHFIPPLSSLEWVQAMTLINENDESYPFPYPGDLSGDNTISKNTSVHTSQLGSLGAFVALSKKNSTASGLRATDYRLSAGHFPDKTGKNSIFLPEEIEKRPLLPSEGSSNYVGIIDEKGRPVIPPLTVTFFKNFPFSNYQTACYKDKGADQMELEASVSADNSCSNQAIENESDIETKRKSIRFMSEWVIKYDSSAEFIIGKGKVDKLIVRAKNIWCKKVVCPTCKSDCESAASSCRSGCVRTRTRTDANCVANCPQGDTCDCTTTTSYNDPGCMQGCADTEKACMLDECFSCTGGQDCDAECDCKHDCSGHPWSDILSYP